MRTSTSIYGVVGRDNEKKQKSGSRTEVWGVSRINVDRAFARCGWKSGGALFDIGIGIGLDDIPLTRMTMWFSCCLAAAIVVVLLSK